MFSAAHLFGYFLFMIVFMVIAIITAKRKISWVLYAIGVIWQYFPCPDYSEKQPTQELIRFRIG